MYRDSIQSLVSALFAAAIALLLIGCIEMEMDMDMDAVDSTNHALMGENGLSNNGLPHNGLPHNGLPHNGLPHNGLPHNGLPHNGLPTAGVATSWNGWLNDNSDAGGLPRKVRNRTLMKYIIRCALNAGATASFEDDQSNLYQWNGGVGVAPEWESGSIASTHERWISACVASLVNSAGVSVIVSQRGRANSRIDAMEPGEETDYDRVEGAYFGNVFTGTPALYSCRGPGYSAPVNSGRSCTLSNGNCAPLVQIGDCADVCSVESRTVNGETFDVYYDCDPDGPGGQSSFAEVVTIYLNPAN